MISQNDTVTLPGLKKLWAETTGSPEIVIAVLDGPADLSHPCFNGSDITIVSDDEFSVSASGTAAQHGTHVASIIFGQHGSEVQGIAPNCQGLLIPIFDNRDDGTIIPCSEIKLASAILRAVREAERIAPGASLVINISGGQFSRSGQGHPLLADAVRRCNEKNVLLVAAAGNEGCDCLHVPGAMPSVLVAGAMDSAGVPLPMSNWGAAYRTQGVLAPGENILGAMPGGSAVRSSGTSFAAPVVSGVAALLLSLQRKLGQQPDAGRVREAILASAVKCDPERISDCRQHLAGKLDVGGAVSIIKEGERSMSEQTEAQETLPDELDEALEETEDVAMSNAAVKPAAANNEPEGVKMAQEPAKPKCNCGQEKWSDKFVYVFGRLEVDFVNQARQDSLQFHSEGDKDGMPLPITLPINLVRYLRGWKEEGGGEHKTHMYDAKSVYWTLWQNGTPIYVIQPMGPFAEDAYRELVDFYAWQIGRDIDTGKVLENAVDRIAISGVIVGEAKLSTNEVVPVVVPHMRGTAAWHKTGMIKELRRTFKKLSDETIEQILLRLYEETRNFGVSPEERAMNYAATNVFEVIGATGAIPGGSDNTQWEFDSIRATKSEICRTDSDCWDVEISFYNPDNLMQARKVTVVTVDVSDVVPVIIGSARKFNKR